MSRQARTFTVNKDTIQHLESEYPDEFVQNFILDLMERYAIQEQQRYTIQVPPSKKTSNEQALYDQLKNIELANALLYKLETKTPTKTHAPMKPTLHFNVWDNVDQIFTQEYQTQPDSEAKGSITGLLNNARFDQLYYIANAISEEHKDLSSSFWRKSSITPLTASIYDLITRTYNSIALAQHISKGSASISMARSVFSVAQERLAKSEQENNQLRVKLDDTESDLNATRIRLLDTTGNLSFFATTETKSSDAASIDQLRKLITSKRWACLTCLAQAYKEQKKLTPTEDKLKPIEALIDKLCTPYTGSDIKDDTVSLWLEEHNSYIDPRLAKALEAYKILPLHTLDLSTPEKQTEYYHPLAVIFSKHASLFPKIDTLCEKYNSLRPSKQQQPKPAAVSTLN